MSGVTPLDWAGLVTQTEIQSGQVNILQDLCSLEFRGNTYPQVFRTLINPFVDILQDDNGVPRIERSLDQLSQTASALHASIQKYRPIGYQDAASRMLSPGFDACRYALPDYECNRVIKTTYILQI